MINSLVQLWEKSSIFLILLEIFTEIETFSVYLAIEVSVYYPNGNSGGSLNFMTVSQRGNAYKYF